MKPNLAVTRSCGTDKCGDANISCIYYRVIRVTGDQHDLRVQMQPLDADDLMHGVIVTREEHECHRAAELEY